MKDDMKKYGKSAKAKSADNTEALGLYHQEKITDHCLAEGNESGNQVPVLKPKKLSGGFSIK